MPILNLPAPTLTSLGDDNILRLLVGSGTQPSNRFEGTPTILEFFQAIKDYGLASKNRFLTVMNCDTLTLPESMKRRLGLFCKAASFPEANIESSQLEYIPSMGEKIATNYNFSENSSLTMTFYCSSSLFERRFFELWQSAVSNPKTQMMNFYDEYAKNNQITIIKIPRGSGSLNDAFNYKFNPNGFTTYTMSGRSADPLQDRLASTLGIFYGVTFYECYPTKISSIEMGFDGSEMMEFTVDIAYKYYKTPVTFNLTELEEDSQYLGPKEGQYKEKLDFLLRSGNIRTGEGLVKNSMDNIADTINGLVIPATNVANRIRQIF